MNIAVVSHDSFWPIYGGGGVRVYHFVKKMIERGHKVTVIAPFGDTCMGVFKEFPNLKIISIGKFNRFMKNKEINYIKMGFRMYRALKKLKPDVVYCGSIVSAFPSYFAIKAPIVYDMMDINTGLSNNKIVSALGPQIEFFIARRVKQVIAISHSFEDELAKEGVQNIKVVYHGVDLKLFDPAKWEIKDMPKQNICISMGGMEKHEGDDLILKAAAKLWAIKFIFIGTGSALDDLKQQAAKLGLNNVKFIGWVDQKEIPSYLARAKIGLISHRYSQACDVMIVLKGLEYMAMGIPVVAPDLKGMIESCEQGGLIYKSEDAEDMVKSILTLMDNDALRESLGKAGRKFVEEHFDWDKNSEKMVKILEEVGNVKAG